MLIYWIGCCHYRSEWIDAIQIQGLQQWVKLFYVHYDGCKIGGEESFAWTPIYSWKTGIMVLCFLESAPLPVLHSLENVAPQRLVTWHWPEWDIMATPWLFVSYNLYRRPILSIGSFDQNYKISSYDQCSLKASVSIVSYVEFESNLVTRTMSGSLPWLRWSVFLLAGMSDAFCQHIQLLCRLRPIATWFYPTRFNSAMCHSIFGHHVTVRHHTWYDVIPLRIPPSSPPRILILSKSDCLLPEI